MAKRTEGVTPMAEIAEKLGVSNFTVWTDLDKIKFRFERNLHFIYYTNDFDIQSIRMDRE